MLKHVRGVDLGFGYGFSDLKKDTKPLHLFFTLFCNNHRNVGDVWDAVWWLPLATHLLRSVSFLRKCPAAACTPTCSSAQTPSLASAASSAAKRARPSRCTPCTVRVVPRHKHPHVQGIPPHLFCMSSPLDKVGSYSEYSYLEDSDNSGATLNWTEKDQ